MLWGVYPLYFLCQRDEMFALWLFCFFDFKTGKGASLYSSYKRRKQSFMDRIAFGVVEKGKVIGVTNLFYKNMRFYTIHWFYVFYLWWIEKSEIEHTQFHFFRYLKPAMSKPHLLSVVCFTFMCSSLSTDLKVCCLKKVCFIFVAQLYFNTSEILSLPV